MNIIRNFAWNLNLDFNSSHPGVAFSIPPENIGKPKGFLIFSGVVKSNTGL